MTGNILYIIGVLALTTSLFSAVSFHKTDEVISNKEVVHYVMDIDMNNEAIEIGHGFSQGLLYGFETTSEIARRQEAIYAVNGMFYNDYGMPLGTMIEDGEPIRYQNYSTPSLLISDTNEVTLAEMTTKGTVYVGEGYLWLYGINGPVPNETWGLFDQHYGSTTRVWRKSTNYIIKEGTVIDVIVSTSPVKLDLGDQVLTYAGVDRTFKLGDSVIYEFDYSFKAFEVETSFQTGGWLVQDGLNVAQAYDPFVGFTTAPQPRTLVGITEANHLLFVVVDGRQQGYSIGVSGYDAAELMLEYGCTNAAYLDGGSSSTMIYEGKLVNQPSGGEERKVAHAIVVKERIDHWED